MSKQGEGTHAGAAMVKKTSQKLGTKAKGNKSCTWRMLTPRELSAKGVEGAGGNNKQIKGTGGKLVAFCKKYQNKLLYISFNKIFSNHALKINLNIIIKIVNKSKF